MGELVEEGIFAVVGGPDGEVAAPGDAALGGFPEEFGVGMFGEFVEADIATIDGHGSGVGGEGDDARAIVEFDEADFDFVGEAGGFAVGVEARDFEVIFAVREDGTSEVQEFGEGVAEVHVFECAWPIFGSEEVIAFFKAETFTDVFEGVAEGPADTDGFFGKSEGLPALGVEVVLGLNPVDLVGEEETREGGVVVDWETRKNCWHRMLKV